MRRKLDIKSLEDEKHRDFGFTKVWWNRLEKAMAGESVFVRVTLFLMGEGRRGNPVDMVVGDIAKAVGAKPSATSMAVKEMMKRDMVRRRGNGAFYVNPNLVFKGHQYQRAIFQDNYRKLPSYKERMSRRLPRHNPAPGEVCNQTTRRTSMEGVVVQ
jgi:hypothetical protein